MSGIARHSRTATRSGELRITVMYLGRRGVVSQFVTSLAESMKADGRVSASFVISQTNKHAMQKLSTDYTPESSSPQTTKKCWSEPPKTPQPHPP